MSEKEINDNFINYINILIYTKKRKNFESEIFQFKKQFFRIEKPKIV